MGIRRRIRKNRRYQYKLIILLSIPLLFGQAEYQIATIPNNAFSLSTHNGFTSTNKNSQYLISYVQYPAQINLLDVNYKKINISILDYGLFQNQIDQTIHSQFYSYEGFIKYYFDRKKYNLFVLDISNGVIISKIESYTSLVLLSNFNFSTAIPTSHLNLGINFKNVGLVLKEYTQIKQKLPTISQFYFIKAINKNIHLGYQLDYLFHTKNYNHIALAQININDLLQMRFSHSTNSQKLFYNNKLINGLAMGISIKTQKNTYYDFSISNLGAGGFIYAITMQF
mgnify:CR=1 FL=1|tara:strand:+ start:2910 stop:3758 length:849 start_codon:yes stop_codon:yes gene_type:complete